ncbi:hypothetical protein [Gimesia maris]|uniref:hypothetical protein n=1 Tax=Gimesia maris TaxID=122 RepID=UPI0032EC38F4
MRVVAVIEKLSDKDETWSFCAETAEGKPLVGKVRIERSRHREPYQWHRRNGL